MGTHAIDKLHFDPAARVLEAHATSLGHKVDRNVVIRPYDDSLCDIIVAEFLDRAVGKNLEGLLHESLVCRVARNEQINIFRSANKPKTIDGKAADHP